MSFREIKGQDEAIGLLRRSLSSGRLAHAYLFHGPEGVGKELAAKNVAKFLNCRTPKNGDACDFCTDCVLIEKGAHPDTLVLRPRGKARVIPIGDPLNPDKGSVRHFQRAAALKPFMGRWKLGIFAEAHALQPEAAVALLKTLEEPPAHTVMILVTARPDMLLPTIISRCQALRFRSMPEERLAEMLERAHSCPRGDAAALSRLAEGCIGEAIRSLREGRLEQVRKITAAISGGKQGYWEGAAIALDAMHAALSRAAEAVEAALAEKGLRRGRQEDSAGGEEDGEIIEAFVSGELRGRQERFFKDILGWYRDILVWKLTGSRDLLIGPARHGGAGPREGAPETERIEEALGRIEAAARAVRGNTDFHTAAENLLVQLNSRNAA